MSWNGCIRQCLASRWSVAFPGVLGVVLIAVGLLLQMIEGVVPCPMCIMQRLVWIAIMQGWLWAGFGLFAFVSMFRRPLRHFAGRVLTRIDRSQK